MSTEQTADPLARIADRMQATDDDGLPDARYGIRLLSAFHSSPRTSTAERKQAAGEVRMVQTFLDDPATAAAVTLGGPLVALGITQDDLLRAAEEVFTAGAVNQDDDSDYVYIDRREIRTLEAAWETALTAYQAVLVAAAGALTEGE